MARAAARAALHMTPSTDQPGSLRVTESVLEALAAHARADAPNECCGLLVGSDDTIVDTRAARNLRASRTRYLIDPRDHFRALRDAREAGLAVIGAYHSHPASPAEPSETDVREATCPGFVYVIVSLASGSGGGDSGVSVGPEGPGVSRGRAGPRQWTGRRLALTSTTAVAKATVSPLRISLILTSN